MQNPILKAASLFDSKAALARAVGVKPPTLQEWESGEKPIPVDRCVQIEELTNGLVMRWDLRPDDWRKIWPELRKRKDAPKEVTHV